MLYIMDSTFAYALGLFICDGYGYIESGGRIRISLSQADSQSKRFVMEELSSYFGININRYIRSKDSKYYSEKRKPSLRLRTCRKELVYKFLYYGFKLKKTDRGSLINIPKDMIRHVIRGMWDGDGSIANNGYSRSFVSPVNICNILKELIFTHYESIQYRERFSDNVQRLYISDLTQAIDLFSWLYQDGDLCRKDNYDKVQQMRSLSKDEIMIDVSIIYNRLLSGESLNKVAKSLNISIFKLKSLLDNVPTKHEIYKNVYINEVYGKLKILDILDLVKGKGYVCECECECGNICRVYLNDLRYHRVKSCGCLKHLYIPHNRKKEGYSLSKKLYSSKRCASLKSDIPFELSYEDFMNIISSDCYFCGNKPTNVSKYKGLYGELNYNGIIRLNKSVGYIVDNVVSCCKHCIRKYQQYDIM